MMKAEPMFWLIRNSAGFRLGVKATSICQSKWEVDNMYIKELESRRVEERSRGVRQGLVKVLLIATGNESRWHFASGVEK